MRMIVASAVITAAFAIPAHGAGNAELGEKVFRKCKSCHMVGEDAKSKVGPILNGIIGATAGTNEDFAKKYSKPMVKAGEEGLVWNAETLSTYLEKPRDMIKGTKMSFAGLKKAEDRENVIAYLEQFGKPAE